MYYAFQLSAKRRIAEANYNTFVKPLAHPDRVMPYHDFLYILEGNWEVGVEAGERCEVFQLRKGDLLILPAGLRHYGTRLCSPHSRNMYIHAEPLPGDHACDTSDISVAEPDLILLPLLIHCGGSVEISRYFSEIITGCWDDALHKETRLSCLVQLLLCELGCQALKSPVTMRCSAFVYEIAQFSQSNPEVFFSVSDMARRFHVSEKTLNNRFKMVYNKTFYAWQMDQKLDMVYQYLHSVPNAALKEIAANFGFYDEFHLSRAFKKKFGTAPKYVR